MVEIFVDGGYHPKYRQGAYAYIIKDGNQIVEKSGYISVLNSREAELMAAELAIRATKDTHIELYTDYLGLIDGFKTKLLTKEFEGILKASKNKKIVFYHMQGHRDNNAVISCDKQINQLWKQLKKSRV